MKSSIEIYSFNLIMRYEASNETDFLEEEEQLLKLVERVLVDEGDLYKSSGRNQDETCLLFKS